MPGIEPRSLAFKDCTEPSDQSLQPLQVTFFLLAQHYLLKITDGPLAGEICSFLSKLMKMVFKSQKG